jgi:hypothetical protein
MNGGRALGHGGREIENEEQSTLMSEHNLKFQKVFNESHAFRRLVDLPRLVNWTRRCAEQTTLRQPSPGETNSD